MVNAEHVEILKQGVEVWDRWRRENPGTQPDLCNANLSGLRWGTDEFIFEEQLERVVNALRVDEATREDPLEPSL